MSEKRDTALHQWEVIINFSRDARHAAEGLMAHLESGTSGWLADHDAQVRADEREKILAALREIHSPVDAVHYPTQQLMHVCSGCGTDDGNWTRYPCRTIRVVESAK